MGLWNALEEQKVTTTNAHPKSERVEQTRSMVVKLLSCLGVRSSGVIFADLGSDEGSVFVVYRVDERAPSFG